MSAVSTDRFGSFLNVDFEPSVAASLSRINKPFRYGIKVFLPQKTKATVSLCQQFRSKKHYKWVG